MRLQARLLLLYVVLFGLVAGLLVLQRGFDIDKSRFVLESELKQHQSYFEKITSVEGKPLETLSADYSFWDEMVEFVKKRNLKFAQDNIDTGLQTYKADAAWVYRPDTSLVYFKSAENDASLEKLNLPADFFKQLSDNRFEHFFIVRDDGLLELRAATIHPGNDPDRKTAPQGYWIVGRYWGEEVVGNLKNLTQSEIVLQKPSAASGDKLTSDTVSFSQPLMSWDDKPVALATVTSKVQVINDLQNLYNRQLLLLLLFTIASILIVMVSIWRLVLRPVNLISRSIKNQRPGDLDQLAGTKTEFGSLAQTIQAFYQQKVTIQEKEFIKSKLIELNEAKSQFLAIAAHELKGPVGNIHLFAANLAELLKTRTPRKTLIEQTERISQQTHKATVLIKDMYQASKGGQYLDLKRTDFDFDAYIKREVENAQYSTRQQLVLKGSTKQTINSDADRLGQVMTNLIGNAAKYSPPESTITVNLSVADGSVVVEVRDSGIGVPEADQPHLFGRFFRSSKVASAYPGLGLGLSVCKEIITALGGKIWLESTEGKGSSFYFSLPFTQK